MTIEKLNKRVDDVETVLEEHGVKLTALTKASQSHAEALAANTALTQTIANNTGELVELFKGAKAFRKFMVWIASPIAGVVFLFDHFFRDLFK